MVTEMTPTLDIDSLPAGPELDRLVAERVMGLIPCSSRFYTPLIAGSCNVITCEHTGITPLPCFDPKEPPPYSANISRAWEVVEKMQSIYQDISVHSIEDEQGIRWMCDIACWKKGKSEEDFSDWTVKWQVDARAHSAPLAICRAALRAKMEQP